MDVKRYCWYNGKEMFASRHDAELVVASMKRKKKGIASVYRCCECNAYHITHYHYTRCKAVGQRIEAERLPYEKSNDDMKIIVDTAYVPDGLSVGLKQLDDGGEQLQVIVFDEEDRSVDARFSYGEALELIEALKLQVAKMKPDNV